MASDDGQSGAGGPEIAGVRTLARGRRFDFVEAQVRARGGGSFDRQYVRHPGAVLVVAAKADGTMVLVRNHRAAVGAWVLECCAGTLEAGEAPEACAARELIEETGYRAGRLEPLAEFFTSPGLTDERMHAFAGFELEHVGAAPEADEWLEVVEMPAREVLDAIRSGGLVDAKSMVAVLLAADLGLIPGVSGADGGAR